MKIALFFCFMTLLGCINTNKDSVNANNHNYQGKRFISLSKNDTVVVGQALDYHKQGAYVIYHDSDIYDLDGIEYWDEKVYGKLVKVSGKLLIEEFIPPDIKPGDPTPQYRMGL